MYRFLAIVALVVTLGATAWIWERWTFNAAGPAAPRGAGETVVVIKPGDSLWTIASRLQNDGVLQNAVLFVIGVRMRGESPLLKAGEYAFPSRVSMSDLAAILVAGRSIEHKITAAEGLTSQMIANIVNADPELSGPRQPTPDEGTLLPETYLFTKGASRGAIIDKMREAQEGLLSRDWAARTPGLPLKTPQEAVTLASVVEKETAIPEERRHIAAVFLNRLRLGMKLESDPTVIYGISRGYPLGRGLRANELQTETPYNTYAVAGLPPTPICNPGKDSIAAVLNPEQSADLYFVADGTGGHAFAATKRDHDRNVTRWRQIESASLRIRP
jgi:UPF0755 protein